MSDSFLDPAVITDISPGQRGLGTFENHVTMASADESGSTVASDMSAAPSPADLPIDQLVEILQQFAQGKSSNILTVTVANPETFEEAITHPETFDLLRVRTGGWTNFFTSVFPAIQEQYRRRPLSTAKKEEATT